LWVDREPAPGSGPATSINSESPAQVKPGKHTISNSIYSAPRQDDWVQQFDVSVGYRLPRRHGEVSLGCLNVTDQDCRLNSLTPYPDLPRERVWVMRLTFNL